MRLGVMVGGYQSQIGVEGFIACGRDLEARGLDTMWIPHVFGHDAIGLGISSERTKGGGKDALDRAGRGNGTHIRCLGWVRGRSAHV